MDQPPTKAKPSAEAEEAPDELDADAQERIERLRRLVDDYAAAFHRKPNPEDLRMARQLREMGREDVLLPETELIPERDGFRVREIPDRFIRVPGKVVNEVLKTPHRNTWERQTWVKLIPDAIEGRVGDPVAVARDLLAIMPASLRARCPGYPGCPDGKEDWDAFGTAAVAVALKIKMEVNLAKHGGGVDAIKIGRETLTAVGCKRARDLLPRPKP